MSVVDRGGDWGERYDRLIDDAMDSGDLIEAAHDPNDNDTWFAGNLDILHHAQTLADATKSDLAALIVWEGQSRGADDVPAILKLLPKIADWAWLKC